MSLLHSKGKTGQTLKSRFVTPVSGNWRHVSESFLHLTNPSLETFSVREGSLLTLTVFTCCLQRQERNAWSPCMLLRDYYPLHYSGGYTLIHTSVLRQLLKTSQNWKQG